MGRTALIVGATGIVGNNLARHLVAHGWDVVGLARRPFSLPDVVQVVADLLDPESLRAALRDTRPTHVFFASWLRQPTEQQNIEVNTRMLSNLLDAVRPLYSVEHVALVTGLKHYLGPFEMYAQGTPLPTPFRESQPRLAVENFYYNQEDVLFAAAERDGFGWSVHRPHTMIGYGIGGAMNIGMTLAVYASICRETGRPFTFPGSVAQWNGLTDMADAGQVARHLEWAATTPAARNQALNIVNGDVFRWSWMWGRLAQWFGLEAAPFDGTGVPMEEQMADAAEIWKQMAHRHGLVETEVNRLASPWHTDADLGRPFECVTDMTRSRELGFLKYQATDRAFFNLFDRLEHERIIPAR